MEFQLQRILGRRITTSRGDQLSLTLRYQTRDITKNVPVNQAAQTISRFLEEGFRSGHLFTTLNDLQLEIKGNSSIISTSKSTAKTVPSAEHDRSKRALIDHAAPYLQALGITDKRGRVLDRRRDKWRQINKYVEILTSLIDKSRLDHAPELTVVDVGSGKGYLTFAAYDHLNTARKVKTSVTGIEARQDLVDLCNRLACNNGYADLSFRRATIAEVQLEKVDILIALHACDTATDEAIYKGIKAGAELIITAPCCHQELRPQIQAPDVLKDVLKQGILLENEAETLTDGLRAMLLEASGYSVKVFEFVGVEHTPKNHMIVGTRQRGSADKEELLNRIKTLMDFYGIREQRLYRLLSDLGVTVP